MCGITGFRDFRSNGPGTAYGAIAEDMAGRIRDRGPDSCGVWVDEGARLAFGHRRLAIVDLTPAGHQPMLSASGRWVICYNGELYNTAEMRSELEAGGHRFRGHSDTEVIVEACDRFGVRAMLERTNGMFAMALWDRAERRLFLARDRLGIKPLYWGRNNGVLFFGSQPKSFFGHPAFRPEIDRDVLPAYFRFNYIPAPFSIYAGLSQLRPGWMAEIDAEGSARETCYWNCTEVIDQGIGNRRADSDGALVDALDSLLRDAIKRQMISDVPLGAFLSGGIDSSTVVALMQAQSSRPVQTFSIGFDEDDFNEAQHAKKVASHLGTDHHELYVPAAEAQAVLPGLAEWYDEPFADSSQIPTYLVSKLARSRVTVALSGDGGDESFAGYNRYAGGQTAWARLQRLPSPLRALVGHGIKCVPPSAWDRIARLVPSGLRPNNVGDRAHKLANILDARDGESFYRQLVSLWDDPAALVPGAVEPLAPGWSAGAGPGLDDFIERMQYLDTVGYLPDDILTKVDRASMAVSLEARVPLLDHRVVEFAWTLPMTAKIRNGTGKWLLRQVLYRYVPQALVDRPKMGFGVPIGAWLRGPLRDWAEDLLSPAALGDGGILDPAPIRSCWSEHLSGRRNWQYALWGVLVFQAWRRRWMRG